MEKTWWLIGEPRKELSTLMYTTETRVCEVKYKGSTEEEVRKYAENNKEKGLIINIIALSQIEVVHYHKIKDIKGGPVSKEFLVVKEGPYR